jgi:dynamin-like GTPase MGM1, mitochondrial
MLERSIAESQKDLQSIKSNLGRRKLRNAIKYIRRTERDEVSADKPFADNTSSPANAPPVVETAESRLLQRAREAMILQRRLNTMQTRISALRSRQCSTLANKGCCPEAYLEVVAEKLTYTAVMFIYVELLNEFFFQLPREIDNKLYYDLSRQQIRKFAQENATIAKHIEVQERKMTLELVMEKLRSLTRNIK